MVCDIYLRRAWREYYLSISKGEIMPVKTIEYTKNKLRFVGGDGEVFDTVEELEAWHAMIAVRLARSEADIANGRVLSAEEAMKEFDDVLQSQKD